MNGKGKKAMALMLALGFFASFLAVAAPAGAAGGRAPAFSVTGTFSQNGVTVTSYDLNNGGNLTIDIAVTNSGDNTTTAKVVLGYADDIQGPVELDSWDPQTLNNDTPTLLDHTWEPIIVNYLFIMPMSNAHFWVEVSDSTGGATTVNESITIDVKMAQPSIEAVTVTSSNTQNASVLVLGVDKLTVKVDIMALAFGKDLTAGRIDFYLDDMFDDVLLGNVSLDTMTNGSTKQYTFETNLSTVTPAPSFGMHFITADAMSGEISNDGVSGDFEIVAPVSDVILTGFEFDPMAVTIHKGETVPVTMTAHLLNNGTADAASATVHFFDGLTELNVTTTEAIAAQATLDVVFVYNITDAITLGNHTLAAGVDSQAEPNYRLQENLTVAGVANVSMTSLTASVASEFENTTVTFTAKLFNNGTVDSDLLTVEFYDGTTMIGSKPNVTVAKGQTVDVTFQWTLPLVDLDTSKTIKAKVAGVEGSVALTIKNKVPIIEFSPMVLPAGMRQYDNVVFNITLKNNGSANAVGVVVKITEAGATYCTTAPFNLSVGESKTIQASLEILDPGDANQTFIATATVGGASFTTNATVKVLHYIFGKIGITAFKVSPSKKDNQAKDSTQTFKATLTLKNIGEKAGTVSVTILDGLKILVNTNVSVDALASKDVTYDLKIKGAGTHKLTAMVGLPDPDTGNMTKTAKCELQYQPGFETAVLVGAVLVAIVLLRRRKN